MYKRIHDLVEKLLQSTMMEGITIEIQKRSKERKLNQTNLCLMLMLVELIDK